MTLDEKNQLLEKHGKQKINEVFRGFLTGKSLQVLQSHYGLKRKDVEDMLRVNFYCLDAIIIDQKEDLERLELAFNGVCNLLPEDIKAKLPRKK